MKKLALTKEELQGMLAKIDELKASLQKEFEDIEKKEAAPAEPTA